jgi:hypothetical protein
MLVFRLQQLKIICNLVLVICYFRFIRINYKRKVGAGLTTPTKCFGYQLFRHHLGPFLIDPVAEFTPIQVVARDNGGDIAGHG